MHLFIYFVAKEGYVAKMQWVSSYEHGDLYTL